MGRGGNSVATPPNPVTLPGYRLWEGDVPLLYPPHLADQAREVQHYLTQGTDVLSEVLAVGPPDATAMLVANEGWKNAPRESGRPYPPGLPYFTRSVAPPALVLPEELSPVFQPRTTATLPLAIWHELAHAFLLQREVVKTPAWLGEFLPQAAAVIVARRMGLSMSDHLNHIEDAPGLNVRGFEGRGEAGSQMLHQNLLLRFATAALEEFGEGFLERLSRALWDEDEIVDERRAEKLLAAALGPCGAEWLRSRPEF